MPVRGEDNPTVIEIPYNVRVEEMREAKQLVAAPRAARKPARTPTFRGMFGWVLFGALAMLFYLVLRKHPAQNGAPAKADRPSNHIDPAALIFWVGIASVFVGFAIIRFAQRRVEQRKLDRIQNWVLDDDGLEQISGPKRMRWPWGRFNSFAETDSLFILRESIEVCRVLPKRLLLNEDTAASVRALLIRKLAPPFEDADRTSGGAIREI
jgi:hypothetical protein